LTFAVGWHIGPCISSVSYAINCILDILCWCPSWGGFRQYLGRRFDARIQVRRPGAMEQVSTVLMRLPTSQTWRATFYLATGLAATCLILGLMSIDYDLPSTETDRRIDWLGALLVTVGLVLVVFVLSDGEIVGWSTSCNSSMSFYLRPTDGITTSSRYNRSAGYWGCIPRSVCAVGTLP
jgi:hypothetical protein